MKKRILALLLVLVLAVTPLTALASPLDDMLSRADEAGLLPPSMKGAKAEDTVTRQQAAELLATLFLHSGAEAPDISETAFEDCDSELVNIAVELGLVSGVQPGKFAPDEPLLRSQLAMLLYRALRKLGDVVDKDLLPQPGAELSFVDVPEDAWYVVYLSTLVGNGILSGVSETEFAPEAPVTVGQLAALALRVSGTVGDPGKEPPPDSDPGKEPPPDKPDPNEQPPAPPVNHPNKVGKASDWAMKELSRADSLDLIPDCLAGADLTAPITRSEFAAVSVKLFEAMGKTKATPVAVNPFTDTTNVEVLKALNVGVTNGYGSETTFAPDVLLTREQAATMLCRVYKRVFIPGWTLAEDELYGLSYTKPAPFSDDGDISPWARDSVYFMAAHEIIQGYNGAFMPRAVTDAQTAIGYAQASREQAILMAVRMVDKLM